MKWFLSVSCLALSLVMSCQALEIDLQKSKRIYLNEDNVVSIGDRVVAAYRGYYFIADSEKIEFDEVGMYVWSTDIKCLVNQKTYNAYKDIMDYAPTPMDDLSHRDVERSSTLRGGPSDGGLKSPPGVQY